VVKVRLHSANAASRLGATTDFHHGLLDLLVAEKKMSRDDVHASLAKSFFK
jgi:hypothetical protein